MVDLAEGEEDKQSTEKKTFAQRMRDPFVALALLGVALFLIGEFLWDMGQQVFAKHEVFAGMFFFLAFMSKAVELTFKYGSPQVTSENEHFSYTGDYIRIGSGNWICVRKGGINKALVQEGREGTYFFPISSANSIGNNMAIKGFFKSYDFDELPTELKESVINENLPDPYFVAMTSEEQALRTMSVPDEIQGLKQASIQIVEELMKDINRENHMLKQALRGKMRIVQDVAASASRIQDAANRSSIREKLEKADILKRRDDY